VATTLELKIVRSEMSERPSDLPVPVPIPEHDPELVASRCEFEISTDPIDDDDSPPEARPDPMPEPDKLLATTVEFQIVRMFMLEIPFSSQYPVPMPESCPKLLASIYEPESNTDPSDDVDFDSIPHACPAPIPQPPELFTSTVELQIVMESIRDSPP
jgi:hypothetical protein